MVVDVRPVGAPDGSDGYAVTTAMAQRAMSHVPPYADDVTSRAKASKTST